MNRNAAICCAALLYIFLVGCGGSSNGDDAQESLSNAAPIALNQTLTTTEDSEHIGILTTNVPADTTVTFNVEADPAHGSVSLNQQARRFIYTPDADFFGTDVFRFVATTSTVSSVPATVTMNVGNINDPPEIDAISDVTNLPDTQFVAFPLAVRDADNDDLAISATVTDNRIADVAVNVGASTLTLRPKAPGLTTVHVDISDGTTTVRETFTMTVKDVARRFGIASAAPTEQAIILTNPSTEHVHFTLSHNGRVAFESVEQIVEAVRSLPAEHANEPFERKLWRFVRDNTYHAAPISNQQWMLAAAPTLNSFGWGFCSNVAATVVQIAKANGLQARMWDLNGHVVPEVQIGQSWHMYDPDLAVYYFDETGTIADVNRLTTEPSLISSPKNPILPPTTDVYNSYLASIYGSTEDNILDEVPSDTFHGARIHLPPGSQLVYPGKWTTGPIGYDGLAEVPIQYYRQARLEIPPGTTGNIRVPWVVADIQGTGIVEVADETFEVGAGPLRAFLTSTDQDISELTIVENSSGVAIVMFINALWYEMQGTNQIDVTGRNVWALSANVMDLPAGQRPPPPIPQGLRKPRA